MNHQHAFSLTPRGMLPDDFTDFKRKPSDELVRSVEMFVPVGLIVVERELDKHGRACIGLLQPPADRLP
ncbi:hypothetical protein MK139_18660, partial [bacterium]|nr:hypothetical protein [bacterium]